MKNTENNHQKVFKGAGYVISLAITMVAAIIAFIISDNFVVSVLTSVPIGITLGLSLEQKFQGEQKKLNPKMIKGLIGLLFMGMITFIILFLWVRPF